MLLFIMELSRDYVSRLLCRPTEDQLKVIKIEILKNCLPFVSMLARKRAAIRGFVYI